MNPVNELDKSGDIEDWKEKTVGSHYAGVQPNPFVTQWMASLFGSPPGRSAISQKISFPNNINHAFMIHGIGGGNKLDGGLFGGPQIGNSQECRVDIQNEGANIFSNDPKDTAKALHVSNCAVNPSINAYDLTDAVGNGGEFVLRASASTSLYPAGFSIDHVHMCSIRCGSGCLPIRPCDCREGSEPVYDKDSNGCKVRCGCMAKTTRAPKTTRETTRGRPKTTRG